MQVCHKKSDIHFSPMKNRFAFSLHMILSVLTCLPSLNALGQSVNILHPDYFGFEAGSTGWWFWETDAFWNVVSEKASGGNFSMRFSYNDLSQIDYTVKAQTGDPKYPGSLLELSEGTHQMFMNVWVDSGTTVQSYYLVIKNPWKTYEWRIDTVTRQQWVTLTRDITVAQDVSTDWQLVVDKSETGGGTFYLDELAIYKEVPVQEEIPEISSVISADSLAFQLDSGQYVIRLKVMKDAGSTTRGFYTHLTGPATSVFWDITSVTTGHWIELFQYFEVHGGSASTQLEIIIPNNPERGGGSGMFLVDDIEIMPASFIPEQSRPVAIAGQDFIVEEPGIVTLDGSLSYDIEGDSLRFSWSSPEGMNLNDPTLVQPTFTAIDSVSDQTYRFILQVTDAQSASENDTVTVMVKGSPASAKDLASPFDILMYPNPAREEVYLSGTGNLDHVILRSMDGKVLFTKSICGSFSSLPLQDLSRGLYIVEFRFRQGRRYSKKLFVQ
jgi:hypothetical protein